jgi:cytochrome c oxidase assembly protein subunit 15
MAVADDLGWVAGDTETSAPSRTAVRVVQVWFGVLSVLGLAALVFGIENRLTPTGVFLFAPPVDLVPPLTEAQWLRDFAVHQQDPVFVACGGTESLAQFKALYGREWLRRASLVSLFAVAAIGVVGAGLWFRFALWRVAGLSLIVVGYFVAGALLGTASTSVETLIRYNVGQYRHTLDATFASIAVAVLLASTLSPPRAGAPQPSRVNGGLAWAGLLLVVVGIATGALFAARNAAAVWPDFPWYEGALLPPLDRLGGYEPLWLNLTFNQYAIQMLHRLAAAFLWVALLATAVATWRRKAPRLGVVVALFALVSAEMATGIATLVLGVPPVPAVVHEVGAVMVCAGVLYLMLAPRHSAMPVISNYH